MMETLTRGSDTSVQSVQLNPARLFDPRPHQSHVGDYHQQVSVQEAVRPYQPAGAAEHERGEAESRPLRLLLAEPVARLRSSMIKVLSRSHYEVLTATDGFEVLCHLPEWRPDVLLLANELPRLGGVQICSLLRQSPDFRVMPVILLVDEDPFLDLARANDVGANACLRRPFRLAELIATLARISGQRPAGDVLPASTGAAGNEVDALATMVG